MEKFSVKMREDCFDGSPIVIHVVNTRKNKKNGFELFKPCDNVCSRYYQGDKLVINGVEISGHGEVSYRQILWHMLLYGMSIKGTVFIFDRNIRKSADFTFRVKSVSVDAQTCIIPMATDRRDIMEQHQKNCIKDRHAYKLGYSDSILIDLPPLSKTSIYLFQESAANTRVLPTTIN